MKTTRSDIISLRDASILAGDADTVRLCTIALGMDRLTERHETVRRAWASCEDIIAFRAARAA